ncbi:hypothetical protein N7478_002844 [Penicillium angulare]|uniref:uncharacterized protein n=1 Tax=Penicillium angulare TaxID=116970 RepID=UPI00253F745F|nr:uncharacterized protein N7478_002844 [Penicillium angulare]KAJ5287158.1 hypothetical protein N7478_002844 [Penicillium angulare]
MVRTINSRKKKCPRSPPKKTAGDPYREDTRSPAAQNAPGVPDVPGAPDAPEHETTDMFEGMDSEEINKCIDELPVSAQNILAKTLLLEDEVTKLRDLYLREKHENNCLRIQLSYLLGGHDKAKFNEVFAELIPSSISKLRPVPIPLHMRPVAYGNPVLSTQPPFSTQPIIFTKPVPSQPAAPAPTTSKTSSPLPQSLAISKPKQGPAQPVAPRQNAKTQVGDPTKLPLAPPTIQPVSGSTSNTNPAISTNPKIHIANLEIENQLLVAAFRAEENARQVREVLSTNSTHYCRPPSSRGSSTNERLVSDLENTFNIVKPFSHPNEATNVAFEAGRLGAFCPVRPTPIPADLFAAAAAAARPSSALKSRIAAAKATEAAQAIAGARSSAAIQDTTGIQSPAATQPSNATSSTTGDAPVVICQPPFSIPSDFDPAGMTMWFPLPASNGELKRMGIDVDSILRDLERGPTPDV